MLVTTQIPLLKLHGSVSWGACQKCKATIVPFDMKRVSASPFSSTNELIIPIIDYLAQTECPTCNQLLVGPPVLVPPTWNKIEYQSHINNVWRKAAKELEQADNIITIGYSMPKMDAFFHYLYALGSESETKLQHFIVINPDKSVEGRFREIVGPGIDKQFQFVSGYFANSISYLSGVLGS
jgi:NAD-dependent SIR2 family protein deacetylase